MYRVIQRKKRHVSRGLNRSSGTKMLGVVRFGLPGRAFGAHRSCESNPVALRFEPIRPAIRYPIAADTIEATGGKFTKF